MKKVRLYNPSHDLTGGRYQKSQLERLYTQHEFVRLPKHEYVPANVNTDLLVAFNGIATCLSEHFSNDKRYPNAQLVPYYSPQVIARVGRKQQIPFMLSWGSRNELPHPRLELLPDYFSPWQLKYAAMRKKAIVNESLDAHGVLGAITSSNEDSEITIYSAADSFDNVQSERFDFDPELQETVVDVVSAIKLARPLRFHAAIKYIPWNNYVGNVRFPDDQTHVLL